MISKPNSVVPHIHSKENRIYFSDIVCTKVISGSTTLYIHDLNFVGKIKIYAAAILKKTMLMKHECKEPNSIALSQNKVCKK